MSGAFLWGAAAASSLVLGALIVLWRPVGQRTLGLVMGFGAGVLISAVAFDLVEEAVAKSGGHGAAAAGLAAGALTFFAGDWWIDRMGGAKRKTADHGDASALPLTLGIVLDGIPESIALGLTLLDGDGIGVSILAAVFLSNLPESLAATAGFRNAGRSGRWTILLWLGIVAVSGLASLAGYALFDTASNGALAFMDAFAAGAVLTMLADTMMPEAFAYGGRLVGLVTTLGFAVAVWIDVLGRVG